ncbi:MAG: large conductance mechanosensitive channel protein MscL [Gemmatimonadaceae bacterium]
MWSEFKAFLLKQNVMALAIAVVIGAAFGKLVTAFVDDFIMPIVGVLIPGGAWREATWTVGSVEFLVGDFASAALNFVIIGFVVWRMAKMFIKPDPAAPATKTCAFCRMSIDAAATRCAHCTSEVARA